MSELKANALQEIDNSGNVKDSAMRRMSKLSLHYAFVVAAVLIAFTILFLFASKGLITHEPNFMAFQKTLITLFIVFMIGAFAPKAIQKFAEKLDFGK